jgi:hypothetical protein
MTIIVSEQQARLYEEGFHEATRLEDDLIELVDRLAWQGPVVVQTIAGQVLFGLTPVRQH